MKRKLLLCLVLLVAVGAGGCACNSWMIPPVRVCDSPGGGAVHEAGCDDCGTGGPVCSDPCEIACGDCAGVSAAPCAPPCGPLTWLFTLMSYGYQGQSCGEIWWGDWHGAPPDCQDPCNRCGEYTGRGEPACQSCAGESHQAGPPRVPPRREYTSGGGPACKSCSGEGHQVGAPRMAAKRGNGNTARRYVPAKSSDGYITDTSSKYAPRLMSTTDRAVDTKRPGSVPQATLPRRMPAHR